MRQGNFSYNIMQSLFVSLYKLILPSKVLFILFMTEYIFNILYHQCLLSIKRVSLSLSFISHWQHLEVLVQPVAVGICATQLSILLAPTGRGKILFEAQLVLLILLLIGVTIRGHSIRISINQIQKA